MREGEREQENDRQRRLLNSSLNKDRNEKEPG